VRVLTWNLYHGRSQPPAGIDLLGAFSARLSAWEWDVALLQEVPPWWPPLLARAAAAEQRLALTSRNAALVARAALARRWPDALKSNGGGCNAILAREPIVAHTRRRLRTWPERRVAQLARLADGVCVVNFHASARVGLARSELARLEDCALAFAGDAPLVLGGDLNLRAADLRLDSFEHVAERDVDHIFARRLEPVAPAQRLARGASLADRHVELSDHVPLLVDLGAPDAGVPPTARA
jgi:endonuclease/exonuclease/phosphatase family metal-dependent hydrolase